MDVCTRYTFTTLENIEGNDEIRCTMHGQVFEEVVGETFLDTIPDTMCYDDESPCRLDNNNYECTDFFIGTGMNSYESLVQTTSRTTVGSQFPMIPFTMTPFMFTMGNVYRLGLAIDTPLDWWYYADIRIPGPVSYEAKLDTSDITNTHSPQTLMTHVVRHKSGCETKLQIPSK